MKDNQVVEILEDGTVYYFDLDVCEKEAEAAIESLSEKQDVVPNYDFTATMFNVFVKAAYILKEAGWLTEDLIDEIIIHIDGGDTDQEE